MTRGRFSTRRLPVTSLGDFAAALFSLVVIVGTTTAAGRSATRLLAPGWPLPLRALGTAISACAQVVNPGGQIIKLTSPPDPASCAASNR